MEQLLQLIAKHNSTATTYAAHATMANPEWAADTEYADIRDGLWQHAIHHTQKGPAVIPAAAKQLKALNVDIAVTRDGTKPLTVTAYTAFGALVLWWERDSLLYWMEVHQTVHAAQSPEFNAGLDVPPGKIVVVEDTRPFPARLLDTVRGWFGK